MNKLTITQPTMSSRDISEMTGKPHSDLLKSIRKMEESWIKVNGGNFSLVEYIDSKGQGRPEYILSKKECLYIATKFNDEARAVLINRWEELENKNLSPQTDAMVLANAFQILNSMVEEQKRLIEQKDFALTQASEVLGKAMPKVAYYENVIASKTTITPNILAQELGLSAIAFNRALRDKGILYRQGSKWLLVSSLRNKGYTDNVTHTFTRSNGEKGTDIQMRWTEKGREFIHQLFKN